MRQREARSTLRRGAMLRWRPPLAPSAGVLRWRPPLAPSAGALLAACFMQRAALFRRLSRAVPSHGHQDAPTLRAKNVTIRISAEKSSTQTTDMRMQHTDMRMLLPHSIEAVSRPAAPTHLPRASAQHVRVVLTRARAAAMRRSRTEGTWSRNILGGRGPEAGAGLRRARASTLATPPAVRGSKRERAPPV